MRDDAGVDLEVLLVSECPHGEVARATLREVLDDLGLSSTTFRTTIITSDEEAQARSFAGSPSFHLGGRDLFPARGQGRLTCRLYVTEDGRAGVPAISELRRALERAASSDQR